MNKRPANGTPEECSRDEGNGCKKDIAGGLDAQLDEALKETFPASDPQSIGRESKAPDRPIDRRPPFIDPESVRRLARRVSRKSD